MSFFSHIGLSVIDKLTGNALDKLGNAIKDGDVTELVKQFTGILEGVEDKLGPMLPTSSRTPSKMPRRTCAARCGR